jgi:hypothetical protein
MSGLEVDLQVMVQAAQALDQSARDLDGIGKSLLGEAFGIVPGSFTLWDPGAHAEYAKARQEVITFAGEMRNHFHTLSMDLAAVAQTYGDTESGNKDGIEHSGDGLDNTGGISRRLDG